VWLYSVYLSRKRDKSGKEGTGKCFISSGRKERIEPEFGGEIISRERGRSEGREEGRRCGEVCKILGEGKGARF
jgi:hypothetical protein